MSALQIAYVAVLGVCIVASGFFSGSETAIIGIPRERVRQLGDTERGRRLGELVADYDSTLSTLLIANNFVNIVIATLAAVLFIDLLGESWGPWLSTLAVTAVILVIGEITPKSLAARYPERYSLTVAPTIHRLRVVLRPLARIFQAIARGVFRLLRIPLNDAPVVTEDDIRAMAELGEEGGEIEAMEREIIHSLFELADRSVREVMTPRREVVTLSAPVTMDSIREAVTKTAHARFPVIDGGLDELVGILYVKDVIRTSFDPSSGDISSIIREPIYVPESKPILELLREMRERRWGFAVVTDEHGGVEGIVTVKDLIAELTGELQDEYDPGSPAVVQVAQRRWLVDGRLPLEDLAEAIGVAFPDGEYSTVGGLFLDVAGRIPEVADSINLDGTELTVLRMDRHRIDRLRVDVPLRPDNG
ncbi:MAG: hemolysin family protein [Acidimicrobiia bacterium]